MLKVLGVGNSHPVSQKATSLPELPSRPNRRAVGTGLNFVNVLCTKFEKLLPILLENNKNHKITVTKGRMGFPSLDVKEKDEPKLPDTKSLWN